VRGTAAQKKSKEKNRVLKKYGPCSMNLVKQELPMRHHKVWPFSSHAIERKLRKNRCHRGRIQLHQSYIKASPYLFHPALVRRGFLLHARQQESVRVEVPAAFSHGIAFRRAQPRWLVSATASARRCPARTIAFAHGTSPRARTRRSCSCRRSSTAGTVGCRVEVAVAAAG